MHGRMSRFVKASSDELVEPPLEERDELRGLALAAARGDGGAAASLMSHVGGAILIVVRRVLGRGADVRDVAQ